VPESFIRGLLESGIEPIIHLPHPIGKLDEPNLRPILQSYARWGARFVIIYDRPNVRDHWANNGWHRKGLVERFVDLALPVLHLVRSSGLTPVLPPLEPGGDYWDTAFLEGALESIHRRREQSLFRDLHLSFYAWAYDKPIDWGYGGPERWDSARPYLPEKEVQNHQGFRIFDWYDSISQNVTGEPLPMICVGAGVNHRYAPVGPDRHEELTLGIIQTLEEGDLPPTVRNINLYLLTCDRKHREYENAWFPTIDSPIASVRTLQKHLAKSSATMRKPLRHYLLLPEGIEIQEILSHSKVSTLLDRFSPVVGHSPFEAQLAQTVTLFGDDDETDHALVNDLEKAGCIVKRLSPISRKTPHKKTEFKDKNEHIQAIIDRLVNENGGREK
jgi:hypothetical protein